VLFIKVSPFFGNSHGSYCSSSPASENALLPVPTDAPQTTLVAEAVPVLDPQTTLNAFRVLLFQASELPQTTEVPFTMDDPQTTEVPQTTEDPQTTEVEATVPLPLISETVPV
jgi:hypothetical protein